MIDSIIFFFNVLNQTKTISVMLEFPAVVLLAGAPDSGKTTVMRYILRTQYKKFSYMLVFTGVVWCDDYAFLPKEYVYGYFDEKVVMNAMKIQQRAIASGIASGLARQDCPHMAIVFDDMIGGTSFSGKVWNLLLTQYRNLNITVFIALQYVAKIPPMAREISKYAFIFRQNALPSYKYVFESFGQSYHNNVSEFKRFIQRYCIGRTSLFYTRGAKTIAAMYIPFKVPDPKRWRPMTISY